ncbi:sugar phosphate isomerase/epimerase family protein [Methanococcus voltae]|uniref:Xylose isomerase domain protein TIM barrel n=1 Tax=Methanococcus voltae (strain ATCC BAA-1334 / A3) TaxID=456320 RepID=D7DT85_METV3|nr:sugar phosphate isomerase/epimerase family protein [Methanococcus voltae]MCS3901195.1 sugar phosphate isomerase/epimerase [Methanococcus voltae]
MIGISSSLFHETKYSLDEALEFLEKRVNYVELVSDSDIGVFNNPETPLSYNLKYTIHCPLEDMNLASKYENLRKVNVNIIEQLVKIADNTNAKVIVLHPGYNVFDSMRPKAVESFLKTVEDMNKLQQEHSVQLTIENMPNYDMMLFKTPDMNVIDSFGDIGITFDMGHSYLNNNIDEFLREKKVFNRIKHVHIHDNNGDFDEHLNLGDGKIPFENYKKALKDLNCIKMVEVQSRRLNNIEEIDKSVSELKKLLS